MSSGIAETSTETSDPKRRRLTDHGSGREPRRVIIDTDPGVDDAFALLLALGSKELVVEGFTIVWGNGGNVKELGANAKLISRLAGCAGVPVSLGRTPDWAQEDDKTSVGKTSPIRVHGDDGLGNVAEKFGRCDADFTAFHSKPAPDFIYDMCKASPGQITLVCIGPLSNVAMSLAAHPDLPELVREVVLMGGAVHGELRGNRTAAAEANFAHDPQAAQSVLSAGFKHIAIADLGVTHQTDICALRDECLKRGKERGIVQFMAAVAQCYVDFYTQKAGCPNAPAHDVVAVMYVLHPGLFSTKDARVEVELKGELTSGMSVVDWTGRWGKPWNCEVLMSVDVMKFSALFADAIDNLPRSI